MTFEVEVGGRTRVVAIEPAGAPGRFRVTLDGRCRLIDVVRSGELGLSLFGTVPPPEGTVGTPGSSGGGHTAALAVAPGSAPGEVLVYLRGRMVAATINGRRAGRGGDAGTDRAGEFTIVAPMPGRVVRVLASPGDAVAARQGIVVVEAMKMENELRAVRAGRVKELHVAPGDPVDAGRILAVIE